MNLVFGIMGETVAVVVISPEVSQEYLAYVFVTEKSIL